MKPASVVLAAVLLGLGSSCGTAPARCCTPLVVQRDVAYVGTIPSTDGGVATSVRLVMMNGGASQLTIVRDGNEIVHRYTTTLAP